jgi:hypothetical protein
VAKRPRIQTRPASGRERRAARRQGRADALASPVPSSPEVAGYRADTELVIGRNDAGYTKISGRAGEQHQRHERARAERDRHATDRVALESARAAAGSATRVFVEWCVGRFFFLILALVDVSGAMVLMERMSVPIGLPPNLVRAVGAVAIGLLIALFPAWAARTRESARNAAETGTTEERRSGARALGSATRQELALLTVAVGAVALIGYARATAPVSLAETSFDAPIAFIEPLDWRALVALGLVTIAAAYWIERYLASRSGAHDAHRAALGARMGEVRASNQMRGCNRRLRREAARWTGRRASEARDVRSLSSRRRTLHGEWCSGAVEIVVEIAHVVPVDVEVRPVVLPQDVAPETRRAVLELEQEAARQLWTVDPFVVVLPRRDPPRVLRAVRQMIGVEDVPRA